MTNCQDVLAFLSSARSGSPSTPLPAPDMTTLQQLGFLQYMSRDDYAKLQADVARLPAEQVELAQKEGSRAALAAELRRQDQKSRSILFHLESKQKQAAQLQTVAEEQAALQAANADLTVHEKEFSEALAKKSLFDTLNPCGDGYVALTGFGVMLQRDLAIRIYRYTDAPFSVFLEHTQKLDRDLTDIANRSVGYVQALSPPLSSVDRAYLWAISVGLAKRDADVGLGSQSFLTAYQQVRGLSRNDENALMSAEILSSVPQGIADQLSLLVQLQKQVQGLRVPPESSLGVASILLLGRRADGTFATDALGQMLGQTKSFESAALLAILNRPPPELVSKFQFLRMQFGAWGYAPSEDVELASAYLTVSELPAEGIGTKLGIICRGMGTYLQYPLVASAILASVPVMEANETLNLLEQAYETIGKRAMPMSQPELICLAVRMVHGIRPETVQGLDTTAAAPVAAPAPPVAGVRPMYGFFWVPVIVTHGSYYSTFSGIGGVHPGHAHVWGGGGFTG